MVEFPLTGPRVACVLLVVARDSFACGLTEHYSDLQREWVKGDSVVTTNEI